MKYFLILCSVVTVLITAPFARAFPSVGSPVASQISISTLSGNKTIPLPTGNWQVAHKWAATLGGGSGIGFTNNRTQSVALVQTDGTNLKAILTITATTEGVARGLHTEACLTKNPSNIFYQNKYQSGVFDQRCLEISHEVNFLSDDSNPQEAAIKSYLNRADKTTPNTAIRMQHTELNRRGQYLQVKLQINPNVYGFNDSFASYGRSPWHNDFLSKDQTKLNFMNDWSAYSQGYANALHGVFENNSFSQIGAFQPRPQSLGSEKSASSSAGTPPPVTTVDFAKTCQGLGFQPNSQALYDCIVELATRAKK